jgi:hypothetical protein
MCQFYLNNNDNSELKPPNILQNYKLFSNPASSALPIAMPHVIGATIGEGVYSTETYISVWYVKICYLIVPCIA